MTGMRQVVVVAPYDDDGWYCSAVRHWNLDRPDPR